MMVVRAYRIMDAVRVEVTCAHGLDGRVGHLVFRADVPHVLDGGQAVLDAMGEVVDFTAREARRGEIVLYDDCGWHV
jgi:hypothetical protein